MKVCLGTLRAGGESNHFALKTPCTAHSPAHRGARSMDADCPGVRGWRGYCGRLGPEGCGNSDVACDLLIRVGRQLDRLRLLSTFRRPSRVLSKLAYLTLCRSIQALALAARGDAAKDLEILVLRHQLAVLRRQIPRPQFEPADRALLAAVSRALPRAHWSCFLVKPDTLLRWHRRLVAGVWTSPHRQTGRPQLDRDVQDLIVRLANEHPRWGYQRIQGELLHLSIRISATQSARPYAATDSTRHRDVVHDVAGVPAPAGHRDRGL